MKDTLIVVSTRNRRDLTGITLDSIKFNKHPDTEVLIVDDASEAAHPNGHYAYYRPWPFPVVQARVPESVPFKDRVGRVARKRITEFLKTDKQFLITLDNDVLVAWRFDVKLRWLWRMHQGVQSSSLLFTGFITNFHPILERRTQWILLDVCGGINQCMTRETAEQMLKEIPEERWGYGWDQTVWEKSSGTICTPRSIVRHNGIYGTWVSPEGLPTIDFIGDESFGGRMADNTCANCGGRCYQDEVVPPVGYRLTICSGCAIGIRPL